MSRQPLQDLYNDPATALAVGVGAARMQADVIAELVAERGKASLVLDVGCGDGQTAQAVDAACARRRLQATVVCCDWSVAALRSTQQKGYLAVRGSVEAPGLGVATGSVDVVLMSEIIEHVVDTDMLLAEARRVLVPGGTLVCSTPNLAAWYYRVLLAFGVQPVFTEVSLQGIYGRPGREVVGHLRLFTSRALVHLLAATGFEDTRVYGMPYHDVPKGFRGMDKFICKFPAASSLLLATAVKPEISSRFS